jgi:hypothetical protein
MELEAAVVIDEKTNATNEQKAEEEGIASTSSYQPTLPSPPKKPKLTDSLAPSISAALARFPSQTFSGVSKMGACWLAETTVDGKVGV